jgi:hypothetical protein
LAKCDGHDPKGAEVDWACSFEKSIHAPFINSSGKMPSLVHLAEGKREDDFAKSEYRMAEWLGYTEKDMVIIHGVGLLPDQLRDVAARKRTVVWSPSSNLLLYGQTLDVPKMLAMGINVTMGPDWTPSGTKNLLEEMRFAWKYSQTQGWNLGPNDFLKMATQNAAIALHLENEIGSVRVSALADLLFVQKRTQDAARDLLEQGETGVDLVLVGGRALYGNKTLLTNAQNSTEYSELASLGSCVSNKVFGAGVLQGLSIDGVAASLDSVVKKAFLSQSREAPQSTRPLFFACEDTSYRQILDGVSRPHVTESLDLRKALRSKAKLGDSWHPVFSALP